MPKSESNVSINTSTNVFIEKGENRPNVQIDESRKILERYRIFSEKARDIIWLAHPDGQIIEVNQAAIETYGYTREELLQMNIRQLREVSTLPEFPGQIEKALELGINFESIHICKDGSTFPVEVNSISADFGGELLIMSVIRNISERKKAEEILRSTRDTFKQLVENSPFGIYVVDADFRLAIVGAGAQKVFENVHPLIGRDFAEVLRIIWQEPFATQTINVFRHTLATGEPYHSPSTIEKREDIKEIEAFEWKIERIKMPDGRFGVVCHFYDLSERRRYEAELQNSEERYRSLVSILTDVLWSTDAEGAFVEMQTAWAEYTGQTWEEMQGFGWLNAFHPEDRDRIQDIWKKAIAEKSNYQSDGRFWNRAAEDYRYFLARAIPLLDEQGNIRQWIGTCTDVTERKQREQNLTFLADLQSEFARLSSVGEISEIASRRIRDYFDLTHCLLVEIDETASKAIVFQDSRADKTDSLTGTYEITNFQTEAERRKLAAGKMVVINDVRELSPSKTAAFQALGIASLVTAPYISDRRWMFALSAQSVIPQKWRKDQCELLQELAARIYLRLERARAEEKLRYQLQLTQSITDSAAVAIFVCDTQGRVVFLNPEAEKVFGYAPEELKDKNLHDAIHYQHKDGTPFPQEECLLWRTVADETSVRGFEDTFYRKDGSPVSIICSNMPLWRGGKQTGEVIVMLDITERKASETALRLKDELITRITDITPTMLARCSRDLRYLFVNQTTAEFLGFPRQEIIGKPIVEIIGAPAFATILPYIELVLQGERVEYEIEVPYISAGRRFMHVVYVPERDENNTVVGWFATITDITESHDHNQKLLAAERRAKQDYQKLISRIAPLAQTLGTAANLIVIYRELLNFIRLEMPCDGFFVSFYDEEKDERTAAFGWAEKEGELDISALPPMPLKNLSGPNARAVHERKTVILDNYRQYISKSPQVVIVGEDDDGKRPDSSVVSPMIVMGKIIGTLEVQSYQTAAYSQEHQVALEMAANLAAAAIENFRNVLQIRESEERFRSIFESIDEGFCIIEMLFDETGKPFDYRFEKANPAFFSLGELPEEAIGKTVLEMIPNLESFWIETYGRVALTGEAVRFENQSMLQNRWFDVHASRVGGAESRRVAIVFNNITERKIEELNQRILFRVSEIIRESDDVQTLFTDVARLLGEYLCLARCFFNEIDLKNQTATVISEHYRNGFNSVIGTAYLKNYSERTGVEVRQGKTVVVTNTETDNRTAPWFKKTYQPERIGAYIVFPMMRNKLWTANLWVSDDHPRQWQDWEISLIETVGERTWLAAEKIGSERKVRESEERLRLAINAAEMFSWENDLITNKIKWSDNVAKILNCHPEEISEDSSEAHFFIPPEESERISREFMKALASGEINFSIEFRGKNNRFWHSHSLILRDSSGKPLKAIGVTQEITERKRAEEKIQMANYRFRIAEEAARGFNYEWNPETNEILRSESIERVLGYKNNELEPDCQTWTDLIHPEDTVYQSETEAISFFESLKDDSFTSEYRVRHKDGHYIWVMERGIIIRQENGKISRIIGQTVDLSERKRAEENLRQSEEFRRLLIESAHDYAIIGISIEGIILSWNTGAERIFGYSEEEIIGRSRDILFTPEERKQGIPLKEMEIVLRKGNYSYERWHFRRDGSRFFASGVLHELRGDNGKLLGFVKIARDQTEKLAAEKAIQDREMLKRVVGALEDERARIARDLHDELGQQLTALRLKLEHFRKLFSNDFINEKIDGIQSIAQNIDKGVDFIAWQFRPAALDDLGLYAALDKFVREWSVYSGIEAELLPSSLKNVRFPTDIETNIYRIAQEALNNINKHSKAKNAELVIEKRDNLVVLIIADNGIGFDPKSKDAFEKGIGLIGMFERAALIGGEIEIESTIGKGTTIYVHVPVESGKN